MTNTQLRGLIGPLTYAVCICSSCSFPFSSQYPGPGPQNGPRPRRGVGSKPWHKHAKKHLNTTGERHTWPQHTSIPCVLICWSHFTSNIVFHSWFGEPLPGHIQAWVGHIPGETACRKRIIQQAWHQCMAENSRPGAHCFARPIGLLVWPHGGIQWCSYPAVWAQWQHLRVGMGQLCWPRPMRVRGPKLKKETMCIWFIYIYIYIYIYFFL